MKHRTGHKHGSAIYYGRHLTFSNSQQVRQCQNVNVLTAVGTPHLSPYNSEYTYFGGLVRTARSAGNLYNRSDIIVQIMSLLGPFFALPSSTHIPVFILQHANSIFFYRGKDLYLGPVQCFVTDTLCL